jgi:hypothetical protein
VPYHKIVLQLQGLRNHQAMALSGVALEAEQACPTPARVRCSVSQSSLGLAGSEVVLKNLAKLSISPRLGGVPSSGWIAERNDVDVPDPAICQHSLKRGL